MTWVADQKLRDGRYTVEKELGRGRFGITYLVCKSDGSRRVVKTLNDDLLQSLNPKERERLETLFWQEAVTLSRCRHPNIVQVGEPFREGQKWCFAMEYVDGISLADRNLPLPEPEALRYIQQIGEALEVVHQNRLIHRDVKPDNVIVRVREGKPEAILIDFGLAFDFDDSLKTVRTRERAEGFAPLELYSQQPHQGGAYTDVYSLAATLYVLLTGIVPPSAIKRKLDKVRLVPVREVNDRVSDRTSRAILTGMELKLEKRPQTIREWLDSLGLIQETAGVAQPSQPVDHFDRKIKIWTLRIAAIAATGGLLGGLAAVLGLFKPSAQTVPPATSSPAPVSSPKTP